MPASADGEKRAERIVSRDTLITGVCLIAIVILAWWWLVRASPDNVLMSGGTGAMASMDPGRDVWTVTYLIPAFTMWALMMVAMMLPSAMPMILLYARLSRQTANSDTNTAVFVLAYLGVWSGFSVLAAVAQAALVSAAIVTGMALKLDSNALSGGLLVAVGLYQLSPLKAACLDQCQSPLSFVMRLWRPGWAGALRLGVRHGLYCVGCCWALMLLLFAGGVMNLAWIALLTGLVFIEKVAPQSVPARKIISAFLLLGGVIIAFAGNIPN